MCWYVCALSFKLSKDKGLEGAKGGSGMSMLWGISKKLQGYDRDFSLTLEKHAKKQLYLCSFAIVI